MSVSDPDSATTLQDIRLEMTWQETLLLASGRVPQHKVTMMGSFSMGFDIEDQQWVFVYYYLSLSDILSSLF